MKKVSQVIQWRQEFNRFIHPGKCFDNARFVANTFHQFEYLEGYAWNDEEWVHHAWNRYKEQEFDVSYEFYVPHLLYSERKIEIVGTVDDLSSLGYAFDTPFVIPLIEQRYRVQAG
ncbi:hypothetical protein NSTC745_06335 [Nostoc sp. DSM 114161]|jgi:hypothetical protein|uniref:hypothetical protein n=1 Tax=Nostoc sp. DSM 114161 TaxID=3440143 RepID=UPI004045EECE